MNFFQAIFLGLVQALTEYLPVSSSAHIRIIGDLMLGSDPGAAFTAIIQIGTELAVILYFRHDIIRILGAWFGSLFGKEGKDFKSRMGAHNRDTQMGWFIIIGTLPILIAGLLFKDAIESTLRNLWITVTVLIIFGILLWVVDARAKQVKTMDDHSVLLVISNETVDVADEEVQARGGAPVTDQTVLDVFAGERLLHQRVATQIDLADGEVVGCAPVLIHAFDSFLGNRSVQLLPRGANNRTRHVYSCTPAL